MQCLVSHSTIVLWELYCGVVTHRYNQKTMGPFCPHSCFTRKYNSPFTPSHNLFSLSDRVMHNKGTHSQSHVQCNCPSASMIPLSLSLNNTANNLIFMCFLKIWVSNRANRVCQNFDNYCMQLCTASMFTRTPICWKLPKIELKSHFTSLHANH